MTSEQTLVRLCRLLVRLRWLPAARRLHHELLGVACELSALRTFADEIVREASASAQALGALQRICNERVK